jgi:hypothetical protein
MVERRALLATNVNSEVDSRFADILLSNPSLKPLIT